jgi:hypothetical protein
MMERRRRIRPPDRPSEADLCFAVYVHGNYCAYIPCYIASVLISYPAAFVKVFVSDDAIPGHEPLDLISSSISNRYSILRWRSLQVDEVDFRRAARWFLPRSEFQDYRYVYIGDVDFLVVREADGITGPHVDHCRRLQVPYSNVVRRGTQRLTGLHFIETTPYYDRMQPTLDKYVEQSGFLSRPNERVLFDLVQEGIGIPRKRMRQFPYRPHHGVHLGVLRGRNVDHLVRSDYWQMGQVQLRNHRHFVDLMQLCRGADPLVDRVYEIFMA